MAELLYRIGRFATTHRLAVVTTWVSILVVVAGSFFAFGKTPDGEITIPGTPTALVAEHLAEALPEASGANGSVVFVTEDGEPFSQEQRTAITDAVTRAAGIEGVAQAVDPFATQAERESQAQQLADGPAMLEGAQQLLALGQGRIDAAREELAEGQAQLDLAREQLAGEQATLDAAMAAPDATQGALLALAADQAQLDRAAAELDAQQAEIDDGLSALADQQATLDRSLATLEVQGQQLEYGADLLELSSAIRLVSQDGSTAVAAVVLEDAELPIAEDLRHALVAAFTESPIDGVAVEFDATIASELPNLLGPGELLGVAIAAVVLFVMLGTLIGAGLPILTALLGVAIGALGALTFAGTVEMVTVTPVLGVMLGLAVGIDYALFIINRHRHQVIDGYTVDESIPLANGTSGNAVLFAGSTVFIALLALNLTGIGFLGLMGTVGAVSVAIAVLIAITLTPALLGFVGLRILRPREREHLAEREGPAPKKPARPYSNGRAVGLALVGIAVLLVMAIPAADLRLGLPLGAADSPESTQHKAYDLIEEHIGAGANGPLVVVADLTEAPAEEALLGVQTAIAKRLAEFDDVAAVAPVGASEDRSVLAYQVLPTDGPTSESTEALVQALRAASPLEDGVTIGVAGQTSGNIDISQKLADALPLYLLVVVGLSLLIMVLVFRSIVVPLVATGGFVLSFFAAIGGVVAIYQWGWLGDIFGVATPGPVLNFLPTVLVGVLFGLAMDYMLFLATGMREAYVHGAPSRTAVVLGLRAGRTVVVAAAIIMISVFGAFVLSESAIIRPIGFALAFGVAVDAFIVRLLIVPALLTLAGDWAWWLPRWLDRWLPNVDVEGAGLERRHPHVPDDHKEVAVAG